MKLGGIPQTPIERIGKALGLLPQPLLDTHIAMLLARSIMEGTRLGVFEALKDAPLPAEEVAARCGCDPKAMRKLAPRSLRDKMLWQLWEWGFIEKTGDYVRTGRPVAFHHEMSPEEWRDYQRGMKAVAATWVPEAARRTPVPKGAQDLLDVGGSHGLLSAALCRRHPGLRAVILDLPAAIEHAAPLLAEEGMGERVTHRAGDVLTDDLGTAAWDVILVANLLHHFDEATNRELAKRIAKALRPGGVYVIQEIYRPESPKQAGQIGALLDLYFALTSQAGTWSFAEMAGWQREAGLAPRKPVKFVTAPGSGQQAAVKR
ncbi:MAG: SAM-dependent methyltransferase [Acidobacteria bacterium]|nr:MAG: SAM-dependent methyltransferase [Acidobacteriota bacterium]